MYIKLCVTGWYSEFISVSIANSDCFRYKYDSQSTCTPNAVASDSLTGRTHNVESNTIGQTIWYFGKLENDSSLRLDFLVNCHMSINLCQRYYVEGYYTRFKYKIQQVTFLKCILEQQILSEHWLRVYKNWVTRMIVLSLLILTLGFCKFR